MMVFRAGFAFGVALAASIWPNAVAAQEQAPGDNLMQLGTSDLRNEIGRRYDTALAATQDVGVVSADSSRYMWASQAKAQCGIALGFLKSGTRDPVSVGKCNDASQRLAGITMAVPSVMAPPPQIAPRPADCSQPMAGIVFFDWDSIVLPDAAMATLDSVVSNLAGCGWAGLVVTGHTDRSGSDAYNESLSVRRATAVASQLETRGVGRGQLQVSGRGESEPKVPTLDGERNPTNRRVEITVR